MTSYGSGTPATPETVSQKDSRGSVLRHVAGPLWAAGVFALTFSVLEYGYGGVGQQTQLAPAQTVPDSPDGVGAASLQSGGIVEEEEVGESNFPKPDEFSELLSPGFDYDTVEKAHPEDNDPSSMMKFNLVNPEYSPGGLCMDGSLPGFWFRPGFGKGTQKWVIHLKGGGWCETEATCADWVNTNYQSGTRDLVGTNITGTGINSIDPEINPNYFEWNSVYVWYCDGGSYTGFRSDAYVYEGTKVYARGTAITAGIIKTLVNDYGLEKSIEVILSGTSAGALGTMLQCDNVKGLIPSSVRYGCLMDAGFFFDGTNFKGKPLYYTHLWKKVTETHAMVGYMPNTCETKQELPWRCFLASVCLEHIQSPIMLIQSSVDYWQLKYNYFHNFSAGINCMEDPMTGCNPKVYDGIISYSRQMINAIWDISKKSDFVSFFVDACFIHTQVDRNKQFMLPEANNESMAAALHHWFGHQSKTQVTHIIDEDPWPHKGQVCAWGPEWSEFTAPVSHNPGEVSDKVAFSLSNAEFRDIMFPDEVAEAAAESAMHEEHLPQQAETEED